MDRPVSRSSRALLCLGPLTLLVIAACSADRASDPAGPIERAGPSAPPSGQVGAPGIPTEVDTSHSVEQRGPRVEVAHAESSRPLRDLAHEREADDANREQEAEIEHAPGRIARLNLPPLPYSLDPVLQDALPAAAMPAATVNFLSQGNTNDPATMAGTPPDTNGAVGPNHFVQTVNSGIAIWDKTGKVVQASEKLNVLWTGYVGTNTGNACATQNDGDPVVVYDQLADRWFITQFSLPNAGSGPNFQCVAVSKTADPAGAYWLYDFQYPGLNDYGKFGIWPDAYYATFNMFNSNGGDADFCAYDRVSMLQGHPATQQCFQQGSSVSGALPVSLDGKIPPPRGEPGYFMQMSDNSSLDLFKIHVDWTTPANSKVTGPTNLKVVAFTPMCGNNGTCVPQPSPGNTLDALSDRLMFRLTYRNFGTHEALMVNHAVGVTGATGGIRWYEIRSPNATPVVYQQGTYAPADSNWRWMASLAQDQSEAMVLGFSISGASQRPAIGWTGRLASDAVGTMGQGETIFDNGAGVETGKFSNGDTATRWGDYSNVTVDPADDCTFWYTQELYNVSGPTPRTWDTQVASVRFPSCAANDFTLGVSPPAQTFGAGATVKYTVTAPVAKGTAETIAFAVQDLPTGVTGAFAPATVAAGGTATLTLTSTAAAPVTSTPVTFTVIGKAPSAVHAASAAVSVGTKCVPITTCPPGNSCGSVSDGCTSTVDCGACAGGLACVNNQCVTSVVDAGGGGDSGSLDDSGTIITPPPPPPPPAGDASTPVSDAGGAHDSGVARDSGTRASSDASDGNGNGSGDGNGDSSGCGCRTVQTRGTSGLALSGFGALAMLGALRRRRRSAAERVARGG